MTLPHKEVNQLEGAIVEFPSPPFSSTQAFLTHFNFIDVWLPSNTTSNFILDFLHHSWIFNKLCHCPHNSNISCVCSTEKNVLYTHTHTHTHKNTNYRIRFAWHVQLVYTFFFFFNIKGQGRKKVLGIEKIRLKCKFHSINSYNFTLVQLCSLTFKVIHFKSSIKFCQSGSR